MDFSRTCRFLSEDMQWLSPNYNNLKIVPFQTLQVCDHSSEIFGVRAFLPESASTGLAHSSLIICQSMPYLGAPRGCPALTHIASLLPHCATQHSQIKSNSCIILLIRSWWQGMTAFWHTSSGYSSYVKAFVTSTVKYSSASLSETKGN